MLQLNCSLEFLSAEPLSFKGDRQAVHRHQPAAGHDREAEGHLQLRAEESRHRELQPGFVLNSNVILGSILFTRPFISPLWR